MRISEMTTGDAVLGFYVLTAAYPKLTAAGKPFLSAVLGDRSGSIEIKVWDYSGPIGSGDAGAVVKISGKVSEYRGAPQITVDRIRLAESTDVYDVSELVPAAPIDTDAAFFRINGMLQSLEDPDYKAVCLKMLETHEAEFRSIPAAKSVHHAFLGGLLMHTGNMLETADFLSRIYGEIIDRSLLIAGAFLHDFAKIREFSFSPLGLVTEYSTEGRLVGHLVMGAMEVRDVCRELGVPEEKSELLQHLLLSHHGEPEFGAAVLCQCAESELLSYIDKIDSRMEIYAETLYKTPAGEFSDRVFALDNRRIYNHGLPEEDV